MFRCVRHQRTRKAFEYGRTPNERADAGSNNHAASKDGGTFFEDESEALCMGLNLDNLPLIKVGYCATLIPKTLVDEAVEWYRAREKLAASFSVRVQGQGPVRVRNMRRGPTGAKQHANGHIAFPKRHGLSESMNIQTPDRAQVSGSG